MKRFNKSKTYLDKDGNRYSYDGKYRGFWHFYKFEETSSSFKTYSETQVLNLQLQEK